MTKTDKENQLVLARQACLTLAGFALGKQPLAILGEAQREHVAALIEQFGRLDAKEQKQIAAGQVHGAKGAEHGKKGGRPRKTQSET